MSEAGERLIEAARQANAMASGQPFSEVFIGSETVFTKALEDAGVVTVRNIEGYNPAFMGIPIRTDARLPDGVYAMVPHGKSMFDDGVVVGAVSAEYQEDAQGFATALAYQRASKFNTYR